MAGVDTEFLGEAKPADGVKIGYLPQEPVLDDTKTVKENVEEGVAEMRDTLRRFEEVSAKFGEDMSDDQMQKLLDEQAKLQDKIDAGNGWELDRTLEIAMDALRCPPGEQPVKNLRWGAPRVALCALLENPTCPLDEKTNTSTPNRVACSSATPGVRGDGRRHHHDRYFSTTARWILELDRGSGIRGRGTTPPARQKRKRLGAKRRPSRRGSGPGPRARVGADVAKGAPGQEQGTSRCLRGAARRGVGAARGPSRCRPPGPRLGDSWSRPTT